VVRVPRLEEIRIKRESLIELKIKEVVITRRRKKLASNIRNK
jgi:hypothetical protein